MNTAWELADVEQVFKDSQDLYLTLEQRESLTVGDMVKVIFNSLKVGYPSETVWCVIVEIYGPGHYAGQVKDTSVLNPNLPKSNELFILRAKNILSKVVRK